MGENYSYNTLNDENLNTAKGLFTINVIFKGKIGNREEANAIFKDIVMNSTKQDFFLETRQGGKNYEMHLPGYNPTSFYTTYSDDLLDKAEGVVVPKSDAKTYLAADGNIWAFKVPTLTLHVTERSNFGISYPFFESWVKTGDLTYSLWYLDGEYGRVGEYLIRPW